MTYLLDYDLGADMLFWREISPETREKLVALNGRYFDERGMSYKFTDRPTRHPIWNGDVWDAPWRKKSA